MYSLTYDTAALATTYDRIILDNSCGIAAIALCFYEYIITIDLEVDFFWRGRLTGATLLFLTNRYIVMATLVLGVSTVMMSFPPESCSAIMIATNVFALVQYIPWAAFSGLRAFALSGGNMLLAISICILSLAPIGAALTHLIYGRLSGIADPVLGCTIVDHLNPDLAHKLTVVSRICLIFADALLILVTWVAIPRSVRIAFRYSPQSFSFILLRDGCMYFIILLILNVLHLVLTLVSINAPFQAASYVIQFIHPITGLLVSRFLCDLQAANRRAVSDSQSLSLDFSRPAISAPQRGSLIFGGSGGGTASAFSDSTGEWSLGREI